MELASARSRQYIRKGGSEEGTGPSLRLEGRTATGMENAARRENFLADNRVSLDKILTGIVTVCSTFGLTVLEPKVEIMCFRVKGMEEVTFSVTATNSQIYKQTRKFVHLGRTRNEDGNLDTEIVRACGKSVRRCIVWKHRTVRASDYSWGCEG